VKLDSIYYVRWQKCTRGGCSYYQSEAFMLFQWLFHTSDLLKVVECAV